MNEIIHNILKIIKDNEEKIINGEPLQTINAYGLKINDKEFGMAILKIEEQGLASIVYSKERGIPAMVYEDNARILKDGERLLNIHDLENAIDSIEGLEENEKLEFKELAQNISNDNLEDDEVNKPKAKKIKEYLKKATKETGKIIENILIEITSETISKLLKP